MNIELFDYNLPEELIAQEPLAERSASRLLVLDKKSGAVRHRLFSDLPSYLRPGDALVLNNTRVIPARLYGQKEDSGAPVELLLLQRRDAVTWEAIVRPGRRLRTGARVVFGNGQLNATVKEVLPDGNRLIRFHCAGSFDEWLQKLGEMPLPPYIKKKLDDTGRYQTIYAEQDGSAAAPTAGLHFTGELLAEIEKMGVHIVFVTLHVGLGTFRPVKVSDIREHKMHSEYFHLDDMAAETLNKTREGGGRILAVGTTSCRVLETLGSGQRIKPQSGWTDLFIYPGYSFKTVDMLLTNFHLPRSTLLMLVSAFAGRENVLNAYQSAVAERYRFFSFGDAMLIL